MTPYVTACARDQVNNRGPPLFCILTHQKQKNTNYISTMPPYQSQMIFIERRCLEEGRESQTEFWQGHTSEMAQLRQTYPGAPGDYLAHLVAVRIWRYYCKWLIGVGNIYIDTCTGGNTFPFPPYTSNVPEVAASMPHQSDDVAEAEQAIYSSSRLTDSMLDRDNSSDLNTIRNQELTQETFSTFELTNDGLSGLCKISHVFKEG